MSEPFREEARRIAVALRDLMETNYPDERQGAEDDLTDSLTAIFRKLLILLTNPR